MFSTVYLEDVGLERYKTRLHIILLVPLEAQPSAGVRLAAMPNVL